MLLPTEYCGRNAMLLLRLRRNTPWCCHCVILLSTEMPSKTDYSETTMLGRPQEGALTDSQSNWACPSSFPAFPARAPDMWMKKPSQKWTLQPLLFQSPDIWGPFSSSSHLSWGPTHGWSGQELSLWSLWCPFPNSSPTESVGMVKWWLFYAIISWVFFVHH